MPKKKKAKPKAKAKTRSTRKTTKAATAQKSGKPRTKGITYRVVLADRGYGKAKALIQKEFASPRDVVEWVRANVPLTAHAKRNLNRYITDLREGAITHIPAADPRARGGGVVIVVKVK